MKCSIEIDREGSFSNIFSFCSLESPTDLIIPFVGVTLVVLIIAKIIRR